jgi:hypothetical protein
MSRTLSEHVTDQPRGAAGTAVQATRDQAKAPPPPTASGDGVGRPPAEPVHAGMRLALWVWLIGFGVLYLQLIAEAGIVLARAVVPPRPPAATSSDLPR